MWSDTLTTQEADITQSAIDALSDVAWAQPVLDRLRQAGGLKSENMPLMFEVRFAYELHQAGKTAQYEYSAGIGDSTIEFKIPGDTTWLIELVSIRTSRAAKNAIVQNGLIFEQMFSSSTKDIAQTEEAEMITAEQKIGEKVFTNGAITKFPAVQDNIFHVILVDARGYLDEGGDVFDYRQMAYGASGIPFKYSWLIHYWKNKHGKLEPITGLYEKSCPLRAAPIIQERIHFIGFICEREYCEREITRRAYYLPNPHMISNEIAHKIYDKFPFKNSNI